MQTIEIQEYQFTEMVEFVKGLNALDETTEWSVDTLAEVLIADGLSRGKESALSCLQSVDS
jgi:hypothetical protein